MKVAYLANVCTENIKKNVYKNLNFGYAVQKYHELLSSGLSKQETTEVIILSSLLMSQNINKKKFFKIKKEINEKIEYRYLSFINYPILRQVFLVINTIKNLVQIKADIVIVDVLNISLSIGSIIYSIFYRKKVIGIVTDVPLFYANKKKGIVERINWEILKKFSGYLFLTEQMNELINKKNKPYVVLEGQVDIKMELKENNLEKKYEKKICLYAGSLKKIYGIGKLVEAFIELDNQGFELHIYGDGDYRETLLNLQKKSELIKYFGTVENEKIVEEQCKATLLINPRPTNEEYTKYSFPSKNMEYMVSGTPLLTTKLPGMPVDHYKYVYLLEDESVEGIKNKLQEILSKTKEELYEKGSESKNYVLKEKNNVIQAKKVKKLIRELLEKK